jgi:hypothetical protein
VINQTEDALWDPQDCANYLGVARWTFVNRISKMPGFPRPQVELSRRMRRWRPDVIKDWSHRSGRTKFNYTSLAAISSADSR